MATINTWFYSEIDDGTGEVIKLGSRVRPQRSVSLGDSSEDVYPIVVRRTVAVDRLTGSNTEATKIFDLSDFTLPSNYDVVRLAEMWLRARVMNACVAWDTITPSTEVAEGQFSNPGSVNSSTEIIPWPGPSEDPGSDEVASGTLTLQKDVWQPIMSVGSFYVKGGAKESLEGADTRSQIRSIYAVCFDDDDTGGLGGLIDLVLVFEHQAGIAPPQE